MCQFFKSEYPANKVKLSSYYFQQNVKKIAIWKWCQLLIPHCYRGSTEKVHLWKQLNATSKNDFMASLEIYTIQGIHKICCHVSVFFTLYIASKLFWLYWSVKSRQATLLYFQLSEVHYITILSCKLSSIRKLNN